MIARSVTETFEYVLIAEREDDTRPVADFDPNATLPDDAAIAPPPNAPPPSVFIIRVLPNDLICQLMPLFDGVSGSMSRIDDRMLQGAQLAVRAGVVGWRNVFDRHGAAVECSQMKGPHLVAGKTVNAPMTVESFDALPINVVVELAQAVIEHNTLTVSDAKN